jgi:hypothetical protein
MPTPVAFDKVAICNQAIGAFHGTRLTDLAALGGTSKEAQAMRDHYDGVVQYVFTMSNWRFATAKRTLNKLSGAPINRWSAAWQLPEDFLKLLTTWPPSNYELANRQVLSNETTRLDIDYIRLVEVGYWPAWFARLVVAELAIRCCKPVTGDEADRPMLLERETAENEAYFNDSQQQPNQTMQSNDFIDCRG